MHLYTSTTHHYSSAFLVLGALNPSFQQHVLRGVAGKWLLVSVRCFVMASSFKGKCEDSASVCSRAAGNCILIAKYPLLDAYSNDAGPVKIRCKMKKL